MRALKKFLAYYRKLAYFRDTSARKEYLIDNIKNILACSIIFGLVLVINVLSLWFTDVSQERIRVYLSLIVCYFFGTICMGYALFADISLKVRERLRLLVVGVMVFALVILISYEIRASRDLYVYLMSLFAICGMMNFRMREVLLIVGIMDCCVFLMSFFGASLMAGTHSFISPYRFVVFCTMIALPIAARTHFYYLHRVCQRHKLERDSETDPLTHMYNRRGMEMYIVNHHYNRQVYAALFDIDDFKSYNDTYGHAAGDDCLQQVAGCISLISKKVDSIAVRYGGEEFAVLFFTDNKELVIRAVTECMRNVRGCNLQSGSLAIHPYVTLSGGLAASGGGLGDDVEKYYGLLAEADRNLYRAKTTGKNRLVD